MENNARRFLEMIHGEQIYNTVELEYAVLLLREARPYLETMIGIASGMRLLLPDVDEFLQHHPEAKNDNPRPD